MKAIIALSLFGIVNCMNPNVIQQLMDVISVNGFDPLSIVTFDSNKDVIDIANYIQSNTKSHTICEKIEAADTKELIVASKNDELEKLLEHILSGDIQSTIVFFIEKIIQVEVEEELLNLLKKREDGCFIYLAFESPFGLSWRYLMSISKLKYPIIGNVTISKDFAIKEEWNMQGMHIRSVDLSTEGGTVLILHCDSNGKNCIAGGFMANMMDMISDKLNFTWEEIKEPYNNPGIVPKLGPNNETVFEGILGSVMSGEYQMSIVAWSMYAERLPHLDFVPVYFDSKTLMTKSIKPTVDFGLFIRPFKSDLWIATGCFVGIMLTILLIKGLTSTGRQLRNGGKSIATVGWFFLLLLEAYYCGALTMYFTGNYPIPFHSIQEVIRAHPEWILKQPKNLMAIFHDSIDPDFGVHYKRSLDDPETHLFDTMQQAFEKLKKEKVVVMATAREIEGGLFKNPHLSSKIKIFGSIGKSYVNYIFQKKSPLALAIHHTLLDLKESGLQSHIHYQFFGESTRSYVSITDSLFTLSAGQVIFIFLIMLAAMAAIILIFVMELVWKKQKINEQIED